MIMKKNDFMKIIYEEKYLLKSIKHYKTYFIIFFSIYHMQLKPY